MRLSVWLFLFLSLAPLSFSPCSAQNFKKLRVVTSSYPPYQGQELPGGGVFDNLAMKVLREAGYKVELVYRPWTRAIKEAKEGEADAILGVWENDERRQWFEFSQPLVENSLVFLCMIKNPECKASADPPNLKGKRLGLALGYSYPKEVRESQAAFEYEQTEETNFKKLLGGRIQYMLVDRSVAYYFMQQRNLRYDVDVRMILPSVATQNLHIGFSKQSFMGLAASMELSRALQRLERAGKLKPLRAEALKQDIRIFNF
jgi:polar amino acid transport system substrate-binding protein